MLPRMTPLLCSIYKRDDPLASPDDPLAFVVHASPDDPLASRGAHSPGVKRAALIAIPRVLDLPGCLATSRHLSARSRSRAYFVLCVPEQLSLAHRFPSLLLLLVTAASLTPPTAQH